MHRKNEHASKHSEIKLARASIYLLPIITTLFSTFAISSQHNSISKSEEVFSPFKTEYWSDSVPKVNPSLREKVACSTNIVTAKLKEIRYVHGTASTGGTEITELRSVSMFHVIYGAFEIDKILRGNDLASKQEIIVELPYPELYLQQKLGFQVPGNANFRDREIGLKRFFGNENIFFLGNPRELGVKQLNGEFADINFLPFSVSYWDGVDLLQNRNNVANEIAKQKGINSLAVCNKYMNRYNKVYPFLSL